MPLDLGILFNTIRGRIGGKKSPIVYRTKRDGTVLTRPFRQRPVGAQRTNAWLHNAWANRALERTWLSLSEDQRRTWQFRDGRRAERQRSRLDQFRSVNLRRTFWGMPCLFTSPDKSLSPMTDLTIPLRIGQTTPQRVMKVYVNGRTAGGTDFNEITGDFEPDKDCPEPIPEIIQLNVNHTGEGFTDPDGVSYWPSGSYIYIHIEADEHWVIYSIYCSYFATPPVGYLVLEDVQWGGLIEVTFALATYWIESYEDAGGKIRPLGWTGVTAYDDQWYHITAYPGYYVSDVVVDGISVGTPEYYRFENVLEDHEIGVTTELAECGLPGEGAPPLIHVLLDDLLCGMEPVEGNPVPIYLLGDGWYASGATWLKCFEGVWWCQIDVNPPFFWLGRWDAYAPGTTPPREGWYSHDDTCTEDWPDGPQITVDYD